MHSDELSTAVTRIVDLLNHTGIRAAVDQYRLSKGDQRTAAAAKLERVAAVLVDSIGAMSLDERRLVKCLHLDSLGSSDYWKTLLGGHEDPKTHQAEIVRLASRVMFASSHLPAITSLLSTVQQPAASAAPLTGASVNPLLHPVEGGEGALFLRLIDAGERASDPDRIARAIDGVDMLYSACASIARKPAIDLRLDCIAARQNNDRDFRFTGDSDSISAVFAVIDSIPAALADIDPGQDIDLDLVVRSLPIFNDLNTLASLGTFSGSDLKDISETMHQGALLTLESGVILIGEDMIDQVANHSASQAVTSADAHSVGLAAGANTLSAAESDEHYNRYLREREAMMNSQAVDESDALNGHAHTDLNATLTLGQPGIEETSRKEAVDELLRSLQQTGPS